MINSEPVHSKKYIDIETGLTVAEHFVGFLGSGIKDKHGKEIFEGDTLSIDFDGAAKVIGDGSFIRDLITRKFSRNAKLVVEFRHARFRLVWRTYNCGFDTGFDVSYLIAIEPFVEIEEAA